MNDDDYYDQRDRDYDMYDAEEQRKKQDVNRQIYQEAMEYNNYIKTPPAQSMSRPNKREKKQRVEIKSSVFAVLNQPSLIDSEPSEFLPPKPITPAANKPIPTPPGRTNPNPYSPPTANKPSPIPRNNNGNNFAGNNNYNNNNFNNNNNYNTNSNIPAPPARRPTVGNNTGANPPPPPPRKKTINLVSPTPTTIQAVEKKVVHKEGYLRKQGKKFKTWKKRFFLLNHKKLQYYTEKGGELIGTIDLTEDCSVTLNLDKKFMIELHVPGRVWLFLADDERTTEEWRAAIQESLWLRM